MRIDNPNTARFIAPTATHRRRLAAFVLTTLVTLLSVGPVQNTAFAQSDSVAHYLRVADAAMRAGDVPAAERGYSRVLQLDSLNFVALRNMSAILANAFMNNEALRLLELAQRVGTADALMLHDLGVLYGRLGRSEECFASHRQAVALEPKNFIFLRDYGAALLVTGQFSDAAQQLERAVRENPTDGETRFLTGNAWAGQDSVARAVNQWETALQVGYDTGPLRYNLGIALESIGDVYAAEEHLSFAVAREPDSLDYRQRLAVFYLRTNIPEQALKHFREALARDSANLNARIGIGAAHALAGHVDSAYAELGYVRSVDSARAAVMSRMIEQNLQLRRTIDSAEAAAAEAKALERK